MKNLAKDYRNKSIIKVIQYRCANFSHNTMEWYVFSVEARAVELINEAIDSCDAEQLLKALQNPAAQLPPVFDYACALYFEEFHNMRDEKQSELDYDEISAAVRGNFSRDSNLTSSINELDESIGFICPSVF